MKTYILIFLTLFRLNLFGQIGKVLTNNPVGIILTPQAENYVDTNFKVIYADPPNLSKNPSVIFFNGKIINSTLLSTLNPSLIDSINIVKENIQIGRNLYKGQINIKSKNNYTLEPISLNQLRYKYINVKDEIPIFTLDREIVTENYDSFFVDKKYLLRIIVEKTKIIQEHKKVVIIKLLTKSDKNISELKNPVIKFRGTENLNN